MKPKSLDQWKNYFQNENSSIFEIIDHAIRVAALDHPKELKLRRPQIVKKLYSCQLNGCCCIHEHNELAVPQETNAAKNKNGCAKNGFIGNAGSLRVADGRGTKVDSRRDINVEISMTQKSKYSYKEAEALTDDIDELNESIREVSRIMKILYNRQEEYAYCSGWNMVMEDWLNAAAAIIKEGATNNGHAVCDEVGLPTPMDEGALLPPQTPMELSESELLGDVAMEKKFENTKRKLHEDYETSENARKRRTKLMDWHDLSKGGLSHS
ncbi:Transcription elongation factor [Quillaja saponaria]|uniref:Transcription elongation factor n=1 Tax=Quillaja saponaria TaxID=32244 RepID=A0AAD7Q802_QUISA|nr:Transcription elongation factor [Quillaja saponaria]